MSASTMSVLGKALLKEVSITDCCAKRCVDLLRSLEEVITSQNMMTACERKEARVGPLLTKCARAFRRLGRSDSQNACEWEGLKNTTERLDSTWKSIMDQGGELTKSRFPANKKNMAAEEKNAQRHATTTMVVALPTTVREYRTRLVHQNKEMYKDPPPMPPPAVVEATAYAPLPDRNLRTQGLIFPVGSCPAEEDTYGMATTELLNEFHPNRTPEEIIRAGAFGGTYFRPIVSAVTNRHYNSDEVLKDTVCPTWIEGLDEATMLTSTSYHPSVNKYNVKCGGSLGMWESSGWISDVDPYGWFQWYCRFYRGRRCSDDARQITRWMRLAGPKGRFRSQLCNKIIKAGGMAKAHGISPVIRQTLLHWGLEITEDILEAHQLRTKAVK